MADLRCPMCGKSNPPQAETCQYCQARLKPLMATPPAIPPEDGGDADWLRGLRDEGVLGEEAPAAPTPPAEEPTLSEGEMPDWLARIRQRTQQEEDALSRIGPAPKIEEGRSGTEEEIPEWLRDLPLTGSDASGIPPWMQGMRPVGEEPLTEPSSPAGEAELHPSDSPSAEDNEAWLRSLGDWTAQTPEPTPGEPKSPGQAGALPADETPDWLSSLDTESAAPALDGQDNRAWLETSGAQAAEIEPQAALPGSEPGRLLPPFEDTSTFSSEEPVAPAPASDLTDWLKTLESEAVSPAPVEPAAPAPAPQESKPSSGMTDWLRSLDAGAEPPAPVEPAAPAPAPQESKPSSGMTDWLRSLEAQTAPPTPAEPAAPAPAPEGSIPSSGLTDWLQSLEQDAAPAEPPETPPADHIPSAGVTGWLAALEQSASAPPPAEQRGSPQAAFPGSPDEGVPDWLSSFGSEEPPPTPAFSETPEALPAENLPEWLRAIEPQQPASGTPAFAGSNASEPVGPFSGEDMPIWVSSSEQLPDAAESYELPAFTVETEENGDEAPPLAEGEVLPAWMSAESTGAIEETEEAGGMIEQAQLPTWLQAMRPLDAAVQSRAANLDEERIEKSGPLAGMSGVLPGEDIVTHYRKPPVYSARLRVSDKQQVLANLLEAAVAEENMAQPLQAEPTQAPQFIVRLLVGLLLVVAVALSLLASPFIGISKGQVAPGTPANEIFRLLDDLPAGSPVLVAVDYEAGLSGEMKAAALPVIQHLMNRKVRIVLVSTQTVGPVLAEDLLKQATNPTRGGVTAYSIPQSSANLGYLVGGAMALRELAAPMASNQPRPLRQALPTPLRAVDGWDGLVLKSLSQITDFKRVLLLTDSIDTGRAWIEQVGPALANRVPLIVVSSAQAAPLLQPYQNSGHIRALLSGLVGGRAYEEVTRRPATAGAYWNAYQVGLGLAVLLIILGGILTGFNALFRRNKKQNQARG